MTNFKTRLATAIATGAVLLNALAMPSFATTITITGNGSNSDNDADVSFDNNVRVDQNNDAHIDNNIDVDADTGNNSADDNTGGDVDVETGDADVDVTVVNKANENQAVVNNCCQKDLNVEISDNGTASDNNVDVDSDNDVRVDQDNRAHIDNDVDADADTGDNSADDNTGGDVSVKTGDATVGVHVLNAANKNSAQVGSGDNNGGEVNALILGNGSYSDNDIDLDFDNDVRVYQDNYAHFDNDIDADVDTGNNSADDNTGGGASVDTGDADLTVDLANFANFNWADIDNCGCFDDLEAKIAGNGTHSDSEIKFDSDSDLRADQDNHSHLDNDVDGDLDTGDNSADDNTSWEGGDPSVQTGGSSADVDVENQSNANFFGEDLDFEWDWDAIFDWFGLN